MSEQIPIDTLLGDRYRVTGQVLETDQGDLVLEGQDQVLNRKVSIVVASSGKGRLLVSNARKTAALSQASVQVLDLGKQGEATYLITSLSQANLLLDLLLVDSPQNQQEAQPVPALDLDATVALATPQARPAPSTISAAATIPPAAQPAPQPHLADYDLEEDSYEEEEEDTQKGSRWILGLAAALLLVIGAGAAFASLGQMVNPQASQEAFARTTETARPSASATASASASASPSPSPTQLPAPKIKGNFTRTVPASPNLMADTDSTLVNLTDNNPNTSWVSLAFGSAAFGGLTNSIHFTAELEQATSVGSLTINQISGTGGAFTIYASESPSIEGAKQVGSGSFAANGETTVTLDKDAQDGKTKYIMVQFTEVPTLSQPIVAGYPFGLRLAEISVR